MKTLLSGNKFNNNHQSYIKGSEVILKQLKDLDSVKKIFLGRIERMKIGKEFCRITEVNGNFIKIKYRSKNSMQEFSIVCKNINDLQSIVD